MHTSQRHYYERIQREPQYAPILPLFADEYRSLLNGLKQKPEQQKGWSIIDCLRSSQGQGKFSPATFADSDIDGNGNEVPADTILHSPSDFMTKQALDYIFLLKPDSIST